MNTIAAVVNFCSNEKRFLGASIEELLKVTPHIIIPVCDHFFDGKKENISELEKIFSAYPEAKFILYPFMPNLFPSEARSHFFHNASRIVGFYHVPDEVEYILFLDVDEIVDGTAFYRWCKKKYYLDYDFIKLYCYWYFREPTYRAKAFETSPLFARKKRIDRKLLMHKDERSGMFNDGKGRKVEGVLSLNEKPMVHHYSWVRTKEEMLKKVLTWGHKKDVDWKDLVEKEFEQEFSGKDFIHGYEYETVTPFVNLSSDLPKSKNAPAVHSITSQEMIHIIQGSLKSLLTKWLASS